MKTRSRAKREETVSSDCDSSDQMEEITEITVDDLWKYYDFEPEEVIDDDIKENLRNYKKSMMEKTVAKINRNIKEITSAWKNATKLMIYVGFWKSDNDANTLIFNINDPLFIEAVQKDVDEHIQMLKNPNYKPKSTVQENDADAYSDDYDSDSEDERKRTSSRGGTEFIKHKKHQYNKNQEKFPCPKEVSQSVWDTWSTAHQHSYLKGVKNPNTYFYRNLPPGETQKNGPWSSDEKEMFMQRLNEMREKYGPNASPQWGIFSMQIKGRVGYQCANFYRKLVKNGEITDEGYSVDENGVLHFKVSTKKKDKAKTEKKDSKKVKQMSIYDVWSTQNPLVGMKDFITADDIKVPAMSPDGYVLDYKTWLNLLKKKSENPFTGKHLNKRQLVILNHENIEEYRAKIRSFEDETSSPSNF